jgi:hypothetical protein
MFVCASPADYNTAETINSLQFRCAFATSSIVTALCAQTALTQKPCLPLLLPCPKYEVQGCYEQCDRRPCCASGTASGLAQGAGEGEGCRWPGPTEAGSAEQAHLTSNLLTKKSSSWSGERKRDSPTNAPPPDYWPLHRRRSYPLESTFSLPSHEPWP